MSLQSVRRGLSILLATTMLSAVTRGHDSIFVMKSCEYPMPLGKDSYVAWAEISVPIPGEKAPDDVLVVKANCERLPYSSRSYRFKVCKATLDNVETSVYPGFPKSFAGKSGKMHALECLAMDKPRVVETFASGVCKLGNGHMEEFQIPGTSETVKLSFVCNDDKTKIISCIPNGQKTGSDETSRFGYFGGKWNKLYAVECFAYDMPDITANYARDVCNADSGPKDRIAASDGSAPFDVFFECNAAKLAILKCFPREKLEKNAVEATKEGEWAGSFKQKDAGVFGKKYEIMCKSTKAPKIRLA